jgi:hypothetical protein
MSFKFVLELYQYSSSIQFSSCSHLTSLTLNSRLTTIFPVGGSGVESQQNGLYEAPILQRVTSLYGVDQRREFANQKQEHFNRKNKFEIPFAAVSPTC